MYLDDLVYIIIKYIMIVNLLKSNGIEFFFVYEFGVILCFFFKQDMVFVNVFNYIRKISIFKKNI